MTLIKLLLMNATCYKKGAASNYELDQGRSTICHSYQ